MSPGFFFNLGAQVSDFTNAHLAAALVLMAGMPVAWKAGRWINGKRENPKVMFYAVAGLIGAIILALIALLAIFISSYAEQRSSGDQTNTPSLETARLIKEPRLDWDSSGRISLQGRYTRPGGPVSVYVTYGSAGTSPMTRRTNTVLGGTGGSAEPRIKVDSLSHFDRDEMTDLTLGFVISDNGMILQWGQPQQNKTKIGITFANYFGNIVLVWNDGKSEEQYPFAIVATFERQTTGSEAPPPIMIGPDILLAQQKMQIK